MSLIYPERPEIMARKPRLAAYFRTSGKAQEREETITRQFENFDQSWQTLQHEYEIVPRSGHASPDNPYEFHFADPGYNLETWDESRAFHDLLMIRVPRREVEVIYISEPDRLFRSRSNEFRGRILDIIQRYNIRILTKTGEVNHGLVLNLLSSIGAEDKKLIMLKCQEGKITRAERENRPPSGKYPFGYHFIRKDLKWVVVEHEARAIRCAAGMMTGTPLPEMPPGILALVQAHPEGLTDPVIVDALNGNGFNLLDYYDRNNFKRWQAKNPTGKIRPGFMDNLIRDDRYRGDYAIYLRAPSQVGHPDYRDLRKDEKRKVILKLPPILTDDLWHELRKKRRLRQIKSKRNLRHQYLVKDLLVCAECGSAMSARPKWSKRPDGTYRDKPTLYYCCWRRPKARAPRCNARRCHSAPKLDEQIFQKIREVILTPELALALNSSDQELIAPPSLTEFEQSLTHQQERVRALDEEREQAETQLIQKRLSDTGFDKQVTRIKKERSACERLIRELRRKIEHLQDSFRDSPPVDIEAIRARMEPRLNALSFEERRRLVMTLVSQVKITPGGEVKVVLRPIS